MSQILRGVVGVVCIIDKLLVVLTRDLEDTISDGGVVVGAELLPGFYWTVSDINVEMMIAQRTRDRDRLRNINRVLCECNGETAGRDHISIAQSVPKQVLTRPSANQCGSGGTRDRAENNISASYLHIMRGWG